jgi:hypothetical protein
LNYDKAELGEWGVFSSTPTPFLLPPTHHLFISKRRGISSAMFNANFQESLHSLSIIPLSSYIATTMARLMLRQSTFTSFNFIYTLLHSVNAQIAGAHFFQVQQVEVCQVYTLLEFSSFCSFQHNPFPLYIWQELVERRCPKEEIPVLEGTAEDKKCVRDSGLVSERRDSYFHTQKHFGVVQ